MLVKIGRDATGRELTIQLPSSGHMLITGKTRSGKSVCLYTILRQLNDPRVRLSCIDPSGIVARGLGGSDPWRVMTLRDIPRAVEVMQEIVAEMDRRIDILLSKKLDKLGTPTKELPLNVIFFEEYAGMLALCAAYDKANGLRTLRKKSR